MSGRGLSRALTAVGLGVGLAAGLADSVAAQPRTAIPWLSDSVTVPAASAPPRPRPEDLPEADAAAPEPGTIVVTPLDAVDRDAVGLVAPQTSGLPRRLWGDTPAGTVRDLILEHPDQGPPAARSLFRLLLLAEADPPAGNDPEAGALMARIDRLLDLGALDEAEALILAAGPETPELFRRWFDIGLLTNRSKEQCAALRQNPALSPTLPARVVCLARGGDWNAAEITLILGQEVGSIPPEQQALLERFLDPVLFEEEPAPPIPRPLTVLDFTMREAVGLPRPSGALPLAFLWGDMETHAPMRTRIAAAERLVRAGSARPATLMEAYRAGAPAASGGAWDRARAVQALDAALEQGDGAAIGAALAEADQALSRAGLGVPLAESYAAALAALDPETLPPSARRRTARLLLLGGHPEAAMRAAEHVAGARLNAALAVAGAERPAPESEPLATAAMRALAGRDPQGDRERRIVQRIDRGYGGEVLLEALGQLNAGRAIDPASFEASLFALARLGQADAAREIAVETLLLPAVE